MKHKLTYLVALLMLIVMVAPASAQGPGDYSYSFISPQASNTVDASSPYLALDTSSSTFTFSPVKDGGGNTLSFSGTAQCYNNDPACLTAQIDGLHGLPFIIFIGSDQWFTTTNWKVEEGESIFMDGALNATVQVGEKRLEPVTMRSRASLQCADGKCSALAFQSMACGMIGDHQLGLAMTGTVQSDSLLQFEIQLLGDLFASDGGLGGTRWQSLGATAYLTTASTPNPVCGGRSTEEVFAPEYTPAFDLPARSAEADDFNLPQGDDSRVDRNIVIDDVSVVDHKADDFTVVVRGHFFGQCGVEPQVRSRVNEGIAEAMIFRDVPEGITCKGGLEGFEQTFSLNFEEIKVTYMDDGSGSFTTRINNEYFVITMEN